MPGAHRAPAGGGGARAGGAAVSLELFTPAARHWYATQWTMLTRRLRYPGRKARNAYRRLCAHWRKEDVDNAWP